MRRITLTREERKIEDALVRGEYVPIPREEFRELVQALAHRRKDAILNIRINSADLKSIKAKARRHGVKYQTFIAEFLHRLAHS